MEKASAARDAEDGLGAASLDFRGHSSPVYGVDFSADSQFFMSASGDGTLRLWHIPLAVCLNSYRSALVTFRQCLVISFISHAVVGCTWLALDKRNAL